MAATATTDDRHDERLLAHVRPPGWRNPTPAGRYNLVVLGGGPAGLVAAAGAAGLGAKVALVERDRLGGDCLNIGCVPSKALIRAARMAAQVRHAGDFGVRVPEGVEVDFPAVMERVRRLRADLAPHDSADRFRRLGIDVFLGEGRFGGPDHVTVGGWTLRFRRAVIATGSRAASPPIPGLEEAGFLTNTTVFSLTALPPRLAVIGGGPIGCELAQAFARLGSQVHLLEALPQLLPRDDPEAAALVERSLRRDGVRLVLGSSIREVAVRPDGKIIRPEGGPEVVVDEILVAAGRRPNVEGLGLEAAGVEHDDRRGIVVDDRLRTANRRIYAAGDACSPYKFTHAADAMARIAIQNALFHGRKRASTLTIPWCTYTDPEVAHVGLSEREAQERGIRVRAFVQEQHDVDRAVLDGEVEGFVKVLVKQGTDRIVGATAVASHAGELISELTLAMAGGVGLGRIAGVIHPYPTQAEAIRKLGDAYNRTRLTPTVERLSHAWLAWTR
jgi:pyruvate/2-oxoglutarate dehydrogenase complex dihydrolipoamide dehydrogenase (E3) component